MVSPDTDSGNAPRRSIADRVPLLFFVAVVGLFVAVGIPAYLLLSDAAERQYVSGYSDFWAGTANPVLERRFEHIPGFPLTEPPTGSRKDSLTRQLRAGLAHTEILDIKVWSRDGALLYGLNGGRTGMAHPPSHGFAEALGGAAFVEVDVEEATGPYAGKKVLEAYVPVAGPDGETANVVEFIYPVNALTGAVASVNENLVKLFVVLFFCVLGVGQLGYYLLARRKRQFETLALQDTLTGLPNRRGFLAHLEAEAERSDSERPLALFLWNVDGLKEINDRFGHPVGDTALREVATRLSAAAPALSIARLDGDEFALLTRVADGAEASSIASRMLAAFEAPMTSPPVALSVSGGISVATTPIPAQTLLRRADIAMGRAKQAGGGTFAVADRPMEEAWEREQRLSAELAGAAERNQLTLEYQPIVELGAGSIVGMEALVRWQHPELGKIPPGEFIGLAEKTGTIASIDGWVRKTALRQTRKWLQLHPDLDRFQIRVNLSASELESRDLATGISALLRSEGLNPARLEVEVTETTVMSDPDRAVAQLLDLKGAGVQVAIDDFGTGYSSLAYLRALPASTVKIDRSFVNGIEKDRLAQSLVAGLVQLGRQFGFDVLAEGIETSEQHALLLRLGCRLGQGYLFGRPMPPEAAGQLLGGERAAT